MARHNKLRDVFLKEIESLYQKGFSPVEIASNLECPLSRVENVIRNQRKRGGERYDFKPRGMRAVKPWSPKELELLRDAASQGIQGLNKFAQEHGRSTASVRHKAVREHFLEQKNSPLEREYFEGHPLIEKVFSLMQSGLMVGAACEAAGINVSRFQKVTTQIRWAFLRYKELKRSFLKTPTCSRCGGLAKRRRKRRTKEDGKVHPTIVCAKCNKAGLTSRLTSDPVLSLSYALPSCRRRHNKRFPNVPFGLNKEVISRIYERQGGLCFYTGRPLAEFERNSRGLGGFKNSFLTLSFDRLDSNVGYTEENVVLCFLCANIAKGSLPLEDFVRLCQDVVDSHGQSTRSLS